ncbi:hypothetical protein QBC45DRAFT_29506 [Copromyces sp. CBS 386.78]|nr:hypothetical protein QBC45DRAFT_29506 [Copromyces sp. CBS 386.78]
MATSSRYPPTSNPHQLQQAQLQGQQQYQQYQQSQAPVAPTTQTKARPASSQRKARAFSFRSDKSHDSKEHKLDLHETSAEKDAKRLHTKADPTLAMNEAEPSEVAAHVKTSLASLRNIQHKDAFGNPISDPDRSNPTRSRWERPLDTIRSFEAAIDGAYSNRRSIHRSESESTYGNNSKRNSYYGTSTANSKAPITKTRKTGMLTVPGGPGYYNSRPASTMYPNRQDGSQHDLRQAPRDTYYDHQSGYNSGYSSPPQNQGRRRDPRIMPNPQFSSPYQSPSANDYPIPSNHRSYETVASVSGSGSSDPVGYQTDPTSSDNSSIERAQAGPVSKRPSEPANDYGIGFSQNTEYSPSAFTVGYNGKPAMGMNGGGANNYQANGTSGFANNNAFNQGNPSVAPVAAPASPQKDTRTLQKKSTNDTIQPERPGAPEKRKSWFLRKLKK